MSVMLSEVDTKPPVDDAAEAADPSPPSGSSRWGRLMRGRPDDPVWVRPSLLALLAITAGLYLWSLGASGWANAFYSAAVQAGTKSWKAMFFGSFDSSNFITVDKPPAALWIMDLSARIFGVNTWSILVPQALEGVAAVGLLYATVRRRFSPAAGLLAGAVFALTPVAALMFRFNNPDALLTLLLVGAAYAMTRAIEAGRTRWLVTTGVLIGFGFLTKMLQAFLIVPVFDLVYVMAAPVSLRRRIWQLLASGLAMLVSAGWWVAIVALTPASARPYVGGSQSNSIVQLIFGYNGFGRITGAETGSVGGGAGTGGSTWGPTGWTRLFSSQFGGQVSWLIPAALISMVAMLWLTRREPRTGQARAAVLLWGGWLVVTGIVFSLAKGIIHPYYSVVLAPAVGALVGIGGPTMWRHRDRLFSRLSLAGGVIAVSVWSFVLLDRSPAWHPWLRFGVLAVGLGSAGVLAASRLSRRAVAVAISSAAILATLSGSAAYSFATAATPHTGAIPSAGPTVAGGLGPGGGPGGVAFGPGGQGTSRGAQGTAPPGGFTGNPPAGFPGGATRSPGAPGGLGGLLDTSAPSSALVKLLERDSGAYRWVAATVGANNAAGIQLATDSPVLAIGGFNGSDPTPTLAQFQALVREGKIHFFLGGGGLAGMSGASSTGSQISTWVQQHFTAQTVGGTTVYDLTSS